MTVFYFNLCTPCVHAHTSKFQGSNSSCQIMYYVANTLTCLFQYSETGFVYPKMASSSACDQAGQTAVCLPSPWLRRPQVRKSMPALHGARDGTWTSRVLGGQKPAELHPSHTDNRLLREAFRDGALSTHVLRTCSLLLLRSGKSNESLQVRRD